MSVQSRYEVVKIVKNDIYVRDMIRGRKDKLLKLLGFNVGEKIAWLDDEFDTVVGEISEEKVVVGDNATLCLTLTDDRNGNKTDMDYPDVFVVIKEKAGDKKTKKELGVIVSLDDEIKSKIEDYDPSVLSWFSELGIENGSKVAWLYEDNTEFGEILIAGEDPSTKPVCWFKKGNFLLPMYEVEYFVLLNTSN